MTEALLAALAAWFALVAVTALPGLRPRQFQTWGSPGQESYLDDFVVFYSAGKLFQQGQGADVYQVESVTAEESREFRQAPQDFEPLPFFNPPHSLLLFAPLSTLKLPIAVVLWTFGTMMLAAAGICLLLRAFPARLRVIEILCLALGLVSSLPFYQVVLHGQVSFLMLFGLCLVYASLRSPHSRLFAVAGLVILSLKPQLLILPALLFLAKRQYRIVLFAAGIVLTLLLTVLFASGPSMIGQYVHLLIESDRWDNQNGISTWGMFGWVGLVSDLAGGQRGAAGHLAVTILDIATLLAGGWFLVRGVRLGRNPEALLSVAVVAGLLASPHFYAQDLLLLVPVLWVSFASDSLPRTVTVLLALGAWFIPYVHFTVLNGTYLNLTTVYLLTLLAVIVGQVEGAMLPREGNRVGPSTRVSTSV